MQASRVALAANADGTVRFMSSETPTPTGSGRTGSAPEPATPPRSVPIGEGKNNFYTSKGVAALRSAAIKAGTPLYNYVSNPNNPVNAYGGAALNTLFGVDFVLNTMSPEIMASNKVPKGVLADINAKTSNIKYGTKVSSVLMHVGPSPVQQFSSDPTRNVLTGNPIYFVVGLEVQGNDGSLIKFSAKARQQGVNISIQKGYTGDSRLALVTVKPTKNTLGQTDIEITGSCGGKADTVIVSVIMPGGSQIANSPTAPVAAAVTTAAAKVMPAFGGGFPVGNLVASMPTNTDYNKSIFAGYNTVVQPEWQPFGANVTTLGAGINYSTIPGMPKDRINSLPENHLGTDIVIKDGNVINPFNGAKVTKVVSGAGTDGVWNTDDDGNADGYGNNVEIELANGFKMLIAHLEDVTVKEGDVLGVGDLIGIQGHSGNTGGKDHVHTELRNKEGKIIVDPEVIKQVILALTTFSSDEKAVSSTTGGGLSVDANGNLIDTNPQASVGYGAIADAALASGLKPQTDVQKFDVTSQVVQIMGNGGEVKLLVPQGMAAGVDQAATDAQNLMSQDTRNVFDNALAEYYATSSSQINKEEMDGLADAMIAQHTAFLKSLKEVLRSGITSLLKFPQEIYKRQREKNDKLKEMTFQGASLDAQRASLRGSVSDLQNKAARAKTVDEYNGYIQQLQQVEGQLRDINTQYAVWQESMRQTKAEGAKFGDFFADLFEDLGTQIMNLFAERAGNMFMAALFPGEYNPGSTVFPTYQSAKTYQDKQGNPSFSAKYNPEGLGVTTSPYGNSMSATYAQNDVTTTITNGLNGVTEAVTKQGEEGTAVMKNGFAASLAASVEAIAVQLIIATAINIFRAAMTERQSDSKKFTAPLDFDTTRGTKNPTGIRNITVNTNISGANQSEVTRIASNEVDKGMNKVRFGV